MFRAVMARRRDIRVVLRSPTGQYLAGGETGWEYTHNLAEAAVFNYLADRIETQLETIRKSHGLELEAVHVAAAELCETCDRCNEPVLPTVAFFNGKQFLCPDCSGDAPMSMAA